MKVFVKRFFRWLFYSVLLLIAGVAAFTYFYGDTIKQFVLSEINKYVVGAIHVSAVDFTLIDNFPDASLEFKNVIALSSNTFNRNEFAGNTDTLLVAKSIYLQFDVVKLLQEDYTIKAVRLDNAIVNIYQDSKGGDNYQLIRSEDDSVKSDLKLKLNKLLMNKIKLSYHNSKNDLLLRSYIRSFSLNGNFVANDFDAGVSADAHIDLLRQEDKDLIVSKDIEAEIDANVYKNKYTLKSADVTVDEQELSAFGEVKDTKFGLYVNLDYSAADLNLARLVKLIPYDLGESFYKLELSGSVGAKGTLAGYLDSEHELSGDIAFTDLRAEFLYKNIKNSLISDGVFVADNFYDKKTYKLTTDTVSLHRGASVFNGRYLMKDFESLQASLSGSADVDLADIQSFIPADQRIGIGGRFAGKVSYSGKLTDWDEMSAYKLLLTKLYLTGRFKQLHLRMPEDNIGLSSFSGSINSTNKDIKLDSLQGVFNGMALSGNIDLANALPFFLLEEQELVIAGELHTGHFNFQEVFPPSRAKDKNKTTSDDMLPDDISARVKISCDGFEFDTFVVNSFSAQFTYSKRRLYTRNVQIAGLGGTFSGSFDLEPVWGGGYVTKGSARMEHINLKKLFMSFNNFGQEFIKDDNLEGDLTAVVNFKALWDKNFEIQMKSVYVDSDLKVENGKLVDFEPLNALSSFVKLDELKTVEFKTLENHILIKDEVITIPQMDINSSLYNMTIDGTQKFDASFKYLLRLSLNEVLAKKFKNTKREKEYFGEIEDDGLGRTNLFLTISGTPDDFKVSYNTKKTIEVVKDRIKQEGRTIKELFRKEFGSKKKDSLPEETFRVLEEGEEEGDFEIDFDF